MNLKTRIERMEGQLPSNERGVVVIWRNVVRNHAGDVGWQDEPHQATILPGPNGPGAVVVHQTRLADFEAKVLNAIRIHHGWFDGHEELAKWKP